MNRFFYLVSIFLTLLGFIIILMGLLQDLGLFTIFDDPPYIVGAGIGVVGAVMAAGYRAKQTEES